MRQAIAIVGMACRFPDARSPDELWDMVLGQRRAFRALPEERLRLRDYAARDVDDPDSIYPIEAAVLEDYSFDRARFRVPSAAMASADLTHWLALEVATDALSDAGLLGDRLDRTCTGVVVGNTLTGEFSRAGLLRLRFPFVQRQLDSVLAAEGFDASRRTAVLERFEEAFKAPFPAPDEETLAGGLSNTIAGRICNHYDFHGGGYTVDGACASSLLAVANACRMLATHEVDTVLAGGVDLSLDPFELVGFARNGALSKTLMRVFDAHSDGFWPGEGCGFLVLMRAEDAERAGLAIRALIRGWGMSTDGAGGLTRPTVAGQLAAIERAYRQAGFGAGTVPLFEAHGTGTAVGDPIEIAAIAKARRQAGIAHPAVVGSVKANIGHTKAAAGVAGLMKAVLALGHQILPAATGCYDVHPDIAAHADAIRVAGESGVWPSDWPLRAGVSAMGFGGINLHLALEGPAETARRSGLTGAERRRIGSAQDSELFVFAADARTALREQLSRLAGLAPRLSRAELADAAAACAARAKGPERAMAVASSPAQLQERLGLLLTRLDDRTADVDLAHGIAFRTVEGAPRIGFLFPGQAAPAPLDGGIWQRRFRAVDELYRSAGLPITDDPAATQRAQPAIITASLAGLAVLDQLGIMARVATGHSLGELAALHWGGAFDAAAVRRLAGARGQVMAELSRPGGTMARIAAPAETVAALVDGKDVVIACFNGPSDHVISGAANSVGQAVHRAEQLGLAGQSLSVSHAFHSEYVAPAAGAVAEIAETVPRRALLRPVVSTVTGRLLPADADLAELLGRQITAPVRFAEALTEVTADTDLLIEVGPGHGLTRVARAQTEKPVIALDVGSGSLAGLLLAAGAAFVLGAPVDVEGLFADRFVRDFDLDRPRRFLANPCEAAPANGLALSRAPRSRRIEQTMAPTPGTPLDTLRAVLARRLELDVAVIEPSHRLLGDLHLNSIAVGQVVAETAKLLGWAPPVAPTNFATATVAQAASALGSTGGLAGIEKEAFPPGVASWIRVFADSWIERPVTPAADGGCPGTWQVAGPADHWLRGQLPGSSQRVETGVALLLPECPNAENLPLFLEAASAALLAGPGGCVLVLHHGGGAAFARCLSLEHPGLRVCTLDLPAGHRDAAGWIAAEIAAAPAGYSEARYDADGIRRVPVLRVVPAIPANGAGPPLGADDVALVSGGAKGIGAECALALAQQTGARLALLGRSAADAPEVVASLQRMRLAGVSACYERADVTNCAEVKRAVDGLQRRLGPISAVMHAAGVNRPAPLGRLELADLTETVAVKVAGLRHLLAAVDPERLKLLIGFGSIIARTGLPGEAHYAVANEWMALEIEGFAEAHRACQVLIPQWSVWSGLGMGESLGVVEALAQSGVAALPPADATALLRRLLASRAVPRRIVIAGRFGALPTVDLGRPGLGRKRFLEQVRVSYPGIELVADSSLGVDSDQYLLDHVLDGTALMPAVLGLEAMVQAASPLAGSGPIVLERVSFDRPISVGSESRRLRVAALRQSEGAIDVVLRSDETGFQADHFSATVREVDSRAEEFDRIVPPSAAIMDSDDVYEGMLFHTGCFRRVAGYAELSATRCIALIPAAQSVRYFPLREADELMIGDPAIRDAALHALQACIPHRRVLPVAVDRIWLGHLCSDRPYSVHGREISREGDRFSFDVDIRDEAGAVVERWEGLKLHAIGTLPLPPCWPLPLANAYIERRLAELLTGAKVRATLAAGDGHTAAASESLWRDLLPCHDSIRRRPDGKPEARSWLSASHAGVVTLAIASESPAGCDMELVNERSEEVWGDLLGPERLSLAHLIARESGESVGCVATRVWCGVEAVKKAGLEYVQAPFVLESREGDWVVLSSGELRIATWVGVIDRVELTLAVAACPILQATEYGTRAAGSGPKPVYAYRHVVGLGDTNLVGNVYFVNHLEWQGRCREMFLRDKAPVVLRELASGLALVTTRCSCEYLAELTAFDDVRLDMSLEAIRGNRIAFNFKYWRCNGGIDELVATGEQEVACLRNEGGRKVNAGVPEALLAALRPYQGGPPALMAVA